MGLMSECCAAAPEYAVPQACVVASLREAISNQLLTNGRPARKQIEKFVATKPPRASAAVISKVQGI
jgi:hypothetical protein